MVNDWDIVLCTLWLFNIAMETGPFVDDFPIEPSIDKGLSMAVLNNQMVIFLKIYWESHAFYLRFDPF